MAFSAFSSITGRRAAPILARHTQKRGMSLGGHHGPPPVWTGVDKVVRGYFPEDYQLAIAILSAYAGGVVLYKIGSAFKSKPPVVEAPVPIKAAPTTTGVPGFEDPGFDAYLESDAFAEMLDSEEQLQAVIDRA